MRKPWRSPFNLKEWHLACEKLELVTIAPFNFRLTFLHLNVPDKKLKITTVIVH